MKTILKNMRYAATLNKKGPKFHLKKILKIIIFRFFRHYHPASLTQPTNHRSRIILDVSNKVLQYSVSLTYI